MAGFLSTAGENYLLDLLTQSSGAYPIYYIALGRNKPPSRHMAGDEFDEPITPDYSRAAYANDSGNWSPRSGQTSNILPVTFPICTVAWGTLKFWAICSEPEGGKLLWAGSLSTPITVGVADQVSLLPGTLTLKTSGYLTRVVI